MACYLRTLDGDRVLLDTKKAKLDYEGVIYDLTGATLEFFAARWAVVPAQLGPEAIPSRGLSVKDEGFTGLGIEVAFPQAVADDVAVSFADDPTKPRRQRKLLRLMRGEHG